MIPEGIRRRPKGVAIVSDINGGAKSDIELPSPSKAGAIEVHKGEDGKAVANGQPLEHEDEEDTWSKTGWAPRFGWATESAYEGESLLDHATWMESQVPEQFYGGKARLPPSQECILRRG